MPKLIGFKKKKIAVFISGKGSNLKNLISYSLKKKSIFEICLVISDNQNSKGLNYAEKYRINKKVVNYLNKKKAEKNILLEIKKRQVDVICLAGFMKILSKFFIKKFKGKIINIHPSLLPKYKGLNTHKRAIDNNETHSGCTVHYVNSKLDSGKVILQKRVKILRGDNAQKLSRRILKQEHLLYPKALNKVLSNL